MPQPKKVRPVGRPKLPKGYAKGKIVPVRFAASDIRAMETAAKASKQNVSEWIRSNIQILLSTLGNSNAESKSA